MASRIQAADPPVQGLGTPYIGCAGWSVPKQYAPIFGGDGTHLQRYARRFRCVEINSSFYRSHRGVTYQRWADATPGDFRFAVKFPKQITHIKRLMAAEPQIAQFAQETAGLGEKLGAVLVQLPPSFAFDALLVAGFFTTLRIKMSGPIVCEPRHGTWFSDEADSLLRSHGVGRVAADPGNFPLSSVPGGFDGLAYYRWHGSPRMYYSSYDQRALNALRRRLVETAATAKTVWCIFDNTAAGAALANALDLSDMLSGQGAC
jgi:uncharacterized protein YecE (DUF72 family)